MRLSELLAALPNVYSLTGGDVEIHRIVSDSRQVGPGALFIAIPGVHVDGHRFIAQAIERGAVAIIGERAPEELGFSGAGQVAYVRVRNTREAWGWLCAAWHNFPSRRMALIGITGTDGKTTTVNLTYHILRAAGLNVGMISTVSARIGDAEFDTGLHTTTPDPPDVQHYLAQMAENGATHAVLEVTSHGLAQHRVAGCDFDVAAITNITHEHLDFHGSYEAYRAAKASLFVGLNHASRKPGLPKTAVLNRDDDSYEYLSTIPAERRLTYGVESSADVQARAVNFTPSGTRFQLCTPAGEIETHIALLGLYNVSNALAAATIAFALGVTPEVIAAGLATAPPVPGRMERIDEGQDFLALVDFAHTPNALERFLSTARTLLHPEGRLIVVFGCAGLRDREKRAMMGRIAARLADRVIITAEDPRTENLDEIMAPTAAAAIAEGKREGVNLWRIPDRGEALLFACQIAQAGDIVAACGKGHEQSMCFGTTEYPWDDRIALRLALRGQTLATLPTARCPRRA